MTPRLPPQTRRAPLAHRALHDIGQGRPENSRAAVQAALQAGYGIEIDVQPSADGAAMVFHDEDLARLTGRRGAVHAHSTEVLRATPLLHGNEGIPTLAEILDLISGQVPLIVEIKDQDGAMGANIGPLEASVAAALQTYSGPVAVMSFNPNSVALMATLCPDIPRGLVTSAYDPAVWPLPPGTCDRLRAIPDYTRTGASFISHEVDDLDRPRVAELKSQGADILCWTVRSAAQEAQARHIAQNITFEGYAAVIPS
ncbi:MAG: glycerophosphodiester phosphodiesterase family protein [Pseudomonadota bacterium]